MRPNHARKGARTGGTNYKVCAYLKETRIKAGLRMQDVAHELDISREMVSQWDCGCTLVSEKYLPKLARLYSLPPGRLLKMRKQDVALHELRKQNSALKAARRAINKTVSYAASELNIAQPTLSKIENGNLRVPLGKLEQFAKVYGVSLTRMQTIARQ